jgi:hypothetical protein
MRVVFLPSQINRVGVTNASPSRAVPNDRWPAWALALATQRIDGEAGVGDTAHRLFHSPGVGLLADGIVAGLAMFRRKCGCTRRQNEWNLKYSYGKLNLLLTNIKAAEDCRTP